MKVISKYRKITGVLLISILLSGFTSAFVEEVPPPQDLPKRTNDKNAGIVIPTFDCTPYNVIKYSYDGLDALMRDPEKGIFTALKTSNFDLKSHKLTFHHKKYGFVTHQAYRVWILFYQDKQNLMSFTFSPFEITLPKVESEVKVIADSWVRFFDLLGWEKTKHAPCQPYGMMPKRGCWPYQVWESDGFEQSVNICLDEFNEDTSIPKYFIKIVFDPSPDRI